MDRSNLIGLAHFVNKNGILVIEAQTPQKANESISEMLGKYSDFKTALFFSGGNTPKKLYEHFADKQSLKVGAVGQIDERFGERNHRHSNELMIAGTGLIEYFESQNVRFYPMLESSKEIEETAKDYDEALRFIFKYFPKSVGILGIGEDGHTAGIPSNPDIVHKMTENKSSLVSYYELEDYGKRITMNFQALSMLDLIIILVLGQKKRKILHSMFKVSNLEEEIEKFPAKFYLRPEIAKKVILVTDQVI